MFIINLALASLGLIGSLAAFGGETWLKGNAPLRQRVTRRGWLAFVCLLGAFSMAVAKEISAARASALNRQTIADQAAKLASRDQETAAKLEEIRALQVRLADLQSENRVLQLASLEAAFSLAVRIPRPTDFAVVHLRGERQVRVPSQRLEQMVLYWGDKVHFVVMPGPTVSARDLASLRLVVGASYYPLHDGTGWGFFEQHLVIYGSSPEPMRASVENPLRLDAVDIKLDVTTTDATQGQQEFRRLVLTGPFRDLALATYKAVGPGTAHLRSGPSSSTTSLTQLPGGSFVRILQTQGEWAEVVTPERSQGWLLLTALHTIT